MAAYFAEAPPADAAWAVFFLTGRRLKRLLPYSSINSWTLGDGPAAMVSKNLRGRRDGAETAALVWSCRPRPGAPGRGEDRILPLKGLDPAARSAYDVVGGARRLSGSS